MSMTAVTSARPRLAMPKNIAVVGMLLFESCLNLFIPSGSGQAYVTMPIMAPLADLVGLTRQMAVLAFQFGDGFSNMVIPTSGILMASLLLQVVALMPLARLRRFEFAFQASPASGPDPEAVKVDLTVTRAYRLDGEDERTGS